MATPLKLRDQLRLNDELYRKTGCIFGLERLTEKEKNPGLYEAVWHILLSVCNTAWEVGCKVSASPVAAEGGDALWALHTPTGECICTSRGITAHVGLLASMVRKLIELGYEDLPGFRQGDIFENNDPHYGGIHMPDMDTAMPIFHQGRLIAWASSVTHVADAGAVLQRLAGSRIGFLRGAYNGLTTMTTMAWYLDAANVPAAVYPGPPKKVIA